MHNTKNLHTKPLVSIIIPTHNRALLIERALNSALQQTYTNIEIIVIDDGSIDNTEDVLKPYTSIVYKKETVNRGQSAARNIGLALSKGDYICTLDSDDIWEPFFVENSVKYCENYQLDLFFSNWTRTAKGNNNLLRFKTYSFLTNPVEKDVYVFNNAALRSKLIDHCLFPSSSMMIKKAAFKEQWNEHIKICDDWELIINLIFNNHLNTIGCTTKIYWTKHISHNNVCDNRTDFNFINLVVKDREYIRETYASKMTPKEYHKISIKIVESRLRKFLIGKRTHPLTSIKSLFSKAYFNKYVIAALLQGSARRLKRKLYKWT